MATLPTLEVTTAQAQYLLGVFGSAEGYQQWLLDSIKARVMEEEMRDARDQAQALIEQRRIALEQRMAGITVPPAAP